MVRGRAVIGAAVRCSEDCRDVQLPSPFRRFSPPPPPAGFEEIRAREEEGETETDNNLAGTLLVGRIEPGAFAQFADPWRQCDRGVFWHGQ
jgi:hypothetical protein